MGTELGQRAQKNPALVFLLVTIVTFPEPRQLSQHMSNSDRNHTNSVVHGDSSALGLNLNVGVCKSGEIGEF